MRKILFLLIFVISCAEKPTPPENLIPEEKFLDVMVELRVLQTFQNTFFDSAKTAAFLDSLYLKFEIDEQQVLESNAYYEIDPEAHHLRKKQVEKRLEEHLEKLEIEISTALKKQDDEFLQSQQRIN